VAGYLRRLHNEELHNLYVSSNIVREIKWRIMRRAGHVARMGEMRITYTILVEKPERKRPFWIPGRRWEDNIRINRREIGWEGVDWIHLAHDIDQWQHLVNAVMNFQFAYKADNFLTSWMTVGFSERTVLRGVRLVFFPF
jgi:hypothetical protein